MGEDEVKGTMMYYDENLGEWRETAKLTEIQGIVLSKEQFEDATYLPQFYTPKDITGTIELVSEVGIPHIIRLIRYWNTYGRFVKALYSGDRRKIKRAKRNFKKEKERYLKEIKR